MRRIEEGRLKYPLNNSQRQPYIVKVLQKHASEYLDHTTMPPLTMLLPASKDEHRRLIDREIESARGLAHLLCVHRNTLALISKLPPELMHKIFLLYQCGLQGPETDLYEATSVDHPRPARDYDMPLEWIKLGHVSQLWRNVAINLPKLWTHISLKNLPWADSKMINERSKKGDLIFRDSIDAGHEGRLTPFISEYLHRIREIDLAVGTNVLRRIFHPEIATSAPLLHCLRLTSTNANAHASADMTADHDILAEFLSRTKILRVLEIDFPLRWDTQALTGLTHLKISHGNHVKKPTYSEIFGALACMEQLVLLHLVGDALPPPVHLGILERRRPRLPAMRTLMLNGSIDSLDFFIKNVDIPQTSRIHLKSSRSPDRTDIPYVSGIVSRIRQWYWPLGSPSQGPLIRGLDLAFSNEILLSYDALQKLRVHILKLKAWTTPPSDAIEAPQDNGPTYAIDSFIDLELPWCPHNAPVEDICHDAPALLSEICHTLPCRNLAALSLRVRDDMNISNLFNVGNTFFLDVFGPQPELKSFYTNPPVLESLLRNMCPPAVGAAAPPPILFPSLRLLHVTNNFRSCLSENGFSRGLYERAIYYHRLDTLSIPRSSNPNNPYNSVALLQQQVTNFVQRTRRALLFPMQ